MNELKQDFKQAKCKNESKQDLTGNMQKSRTSPFWQERFKFSFFVAHSFFGVTLLSFGGRKLLNQNNFIFFISSPWTSTIYGPKG